MLMMNPSNVFLSKYSVMLDHIYVLLSLSSLNLSFKISKHHAGAIMNSVVHK